MTDTKIQTNSKNNENELSKSQNKYDAVRKQISNLTTTVNNDKIKLADLSIIKDDGNLSPKQAEEHKHLKRKIEVNGESIKDKTTSNSTLLRTINALKKQIENDGKGEAASAQEVMLNSKITETNKAIRHILKITGTTNLVEFVQYVEKTLPSNS